MNILISDVAEIVLLEDLTNKFESLPKGKEKKMKPKWQFRLYHLFALCVITFLLGGCATMRPPALNSETTDIDVSNESIALLTVKVANNYSASYQPNIKLAFVWSEAEKDREKYSFSVDEKYREVENSFNEYLISFQLPAGKYNLRELWGQSGFFPVIGTFSVPIYSSFSLEPQKIIYLGHIDARCSRTVKIDCPKL